MKKFAVYYFEQIGKRKQDVCYTIKAESEESAKIEFEYLLSMGRIDGFCANKGFTISECF
jgi:hypothetical protein